MKNALIHKDIIVIGGGVAGYTYALFQKALDPKREVTVYERTDKTLGRILVSGNGRSNFFNTYLKENKLPNDPLFDKARLIVEPDWGSKAFNFLLDLIKMPYFVQDNWLIYPFANKADVLKNALEETGKRLGIKVETKTFIEAYLAEKKTVVTKFIDNESHESLIEAEKTVLAMGGQSLQYPPFPWTSLKGLNIDYKPYVPALVPLITKENTVAIQGQRVKGTIRLLDKGKEVYQEDGEVLFKKDGLSGICIFNASIRLDQTRFDDYELVLDITKHDGMELDLTKIKPEQAFVKPVADYLHSRAKDENKAVSEVAAKLTFRIKSTYPFRDAQVSKGGILFDQIDPETMRLKKIPQVCVLGELLDIPLPCGGYNIGLSIVEAYKAACQ